MYHKNFIVPTTQLLRSIILETYCLGEEDRLNSLDHEDLYVRIDIQLIGTYDEYLGDFMNVIMIALDPTCETVLIARRGTPFLRLVPGLVVARNERLEDCLDKIDAAMSRICTAYNYYSLEFEIKAKVMLGWDIDPLTSVNLDINPTIPPNLY